MFRKVPKESVSHPEVHTLLCKLQQQSEVIVKLYQCYPQCNVIMLLNLEHFWLWVGGNLQYLMLGFVNENAQYVED